MTIPSTISRRGLLRGFAVISTAAFTSAWLREAKADANGTLTVALC
jgi:hypothetical protein